MAGENMLKFWTNDAVMAGAADSGFPNAPRSIMTLPTKLTVTSTDPKLKRNDELNAYFHAMAGYSEGPDDDVTVWAHWSSSSPDVVEVDEATVFARVLAVGTAIITAECNGQKGATTVTVYAPKATGITISESEETIRGGKLKLPGGGKRNFTATYIFSDVGGSEEPQVEWSSSAPAVIAINKKTGVATMLAADTATISAHDASTGFEDKVEVTVVAPGEGARKVGLLITVNDFKGETMGNIAAVAHFQANDAEFDVYANDFVRDGIFKADDLFLMPEGTLTFRTAHPNSLTGSASHAAIYTLPASGNLKFTADQIALHGTTTAGKAEEAATKLGFKGTVGVDIKAVKLGGEVSQETEHKTSESQQDTWDVYAGTDGYNLVQK